MPAFDAVFLDRDGTINVKAAEGEYIRTAEKFTLLPGVAAALRRLNESACLAIIVTNQRGIARGLLTKSNLHDVHAHMVALLAAEGARVDAIYYCPHEIDACDCRKPKTGLIDEALRDFPWIRRHAAAVIGDSNGDVEAGRRSGLYTVRLRDRLDRDQLGRHASDCEAPDLASAVDLLFRLQPAADDEAGHPSRHPQDHSPW